MAGGSGVAAAPSAGRAFAAAAPLTRRQLLDAPVRSPRPSRLRQPLEVPGRRVAAGARALGLHTVEDLLTHLPTESRDARAVAGLRAGEQATIAVTVRSIRSRPVRRRHMRALVEAVVHDPSGSIRATFFNQPWLVERYPPGTHLVLDGRPDDRGGFRVSSHALAADMPATAPAQDGSVAHYPASDGITSTQILALVQAARPSLADFPEPLPGRIRAAQRLPERAAALSAMHFPRDPDELELGRSRLAFDELLLSQLVFLQRRAERRARTGAHPLCEPPALTARWLEQALPFALTGDQRDAIAEIAADLAREAPMQRLLMGDVGSGKTVVALHALLRAVEHGLQGALMAPTETLAEQHFATIQRLLGAEPVSAALLTGSTPPRRRAEHLSRLASGELSLIVGTHALIEPDVRFAALAVVVVDEQHRFGVRQRAALAERAGARPPHTLHMTATPIPRTLALARFGDLDTTRLAELPAGRRPVLTRILAGERERASAYEELREQLRAGRQAYVVCPLVEELEEPDPAASSGEELKAATAELARLEQGELRGFRLALMHGAMRPREKQQAMASFAEGDADVLVATTVIEVGIDVPNATAMLIENAERFGISQLHQLRGRVGRGEHSSLCFLLPGPAAASSPRLRALATHSDGFRLAEIDLALRREGDLGGTRQSGGGRFRVARLPDDEQLLESAHAHARALIDRDPQLADPEHALLAAEVERAREGELGEPLPA